MEQIRLLFLSFFILFSVASLAQTSDSTINASSIRAAHRIWKETKFYMGDEIDYTPREVFQFKFLDTIPSLYRMKIPPRDVNKDFYFKFHVANKMDSAGHYYLLPGYFMDEIDLYKQIDGDTAIQTIATGSPLKNQYQGVVDFTMQANEKATIIVKMKFIRATVNTLEPRIIQPYFVPILLTSLRNTNKLNQVITYITAGVLLMMIFYSLAVYFLNSNKEFILYCGHALFLSILFFFKAYLYHWPSAFNYFFESYFDFVIQSTSFYFFLFFLRKFTESKEKYPIIEKILLADQVFTVVGILVFSYLYFFTDSFIVFNQVEMIIKYSWSITAACFIVFAIIKKQQLLSLIAMGHFLLLISVLFSLYLISSDNRFGSRVDPLLNDSLFYYEMGVVCELIFFLIALAFKNRQDIIAAATEKERLLLAHERNQLEKQIAIIEAQQQERNRISADMHDELGSGVTAIRLLSELVKAKMKGDALPEVERISSSANDLINKMNTIIWTMKSSNDSIDNLAAYIRSYALEFLENTSIDCYFKYPPVIPAIELSGEKRRNIFLCVKETLNNTVKHAGATQVIITMDVNEVLILTLKDNGIGLKKEDMRQFGNGILNMRKRMESIEGYFEIFEDDGTVTVLSLAI
ncbi:7TM diverse intracellular signaling domain-containing protein [Chitinophagaceae bacterium 26-R-25]|nr:7TM diverse intracellular signaling domain-containing protein [Chitinophagaceae bacterium 26-R-25]